MPARPGEALTLGVGLDYSEVKAGFGQIGSGADAVAAKVNSLGAGMQSPFSGLGKAADGAGLSMTKLAGTIAGSVAGYFAVERVMDAVRGQIVETFQAALESENAFLRLQSAVELSGKSWAGAEKPLREYFDTIQQTTRFSDEDAAETLQRLIIFTGDYETALKALPTVLDLAARLHVNLDVAAKIIGVAIEGNTAALARYGVRLDDTTKELLKHADQTARTEIIIDALGKKMRGSAAADAVSLQGQLAILRNNFGEVREQAGLFALDLVKNSDAAGGFTSQLVLLQQAIGSLRESSPLEIPIEVTGIGQIKNALDFTAILFDAAALRAAVFSGDSEKAADALIRIGEVAARSATPEVQSMFKEMSAAARGVLPNVQDVTDKVNALISATEQGSVGGAAIEQFVNPGLDALQNLGDKGIAPTTLKIAALKDQIHAWSGVAIRIPELAGEAAREIAKLWEEIDKIASPSLWTTLGEESKSALENVRNTFALALVGVVPRDQIAGEVETLVKIWKDGGDNDAKQYLSALKTALSGGTGPVSDAITGLGSDSARTARLFTTAWEDVRKARVEDTFDLIQQKIALYSDEADKGGQWSDVYREKVRALRTELLALGTVKLEKPTPMDFIGKGGREDANPFMDTTPSKGIEDLAGKSNQGLLAAFGVTVGNLPGALGDAKDASKLLRAEMKLGQISAKQFDDAIKNLIDHLKELGATQGEVAGATGGTTEAVFTAVDAQDAFSSALTNVGSAFASALSSSQSDWKKQLGQQLKGQAIYSAVEAVINLALAAAASTGWGAAVLGPPAGYYKAAATWGIAAGVAGAGAAALGGGGGGGSVSSSAGAGSSAGGGSASRLGQLSAGSRDFSTSMPGAKGGDTNVNIYAQDGEDVQRAFKKRAYRKSIERINDRAARRS
jgi:hypothetical protein